MSFLGIVAILGQSCNGFLACDVASQLGDGFCPSAVGFTRELLQENTHISACCARQKSRDGCLAWFPHRKGAGSPPSVLTGQQAAGAAPAAEPSAPSSDPKPRHMQLATTSLLHALQNSLADSLERPDSMRNPPKNESISSAKHNKKLAAEICATQPRSDGGADSAGTVAARGGLAAPAAPRWLPGPQQGQAFKRAEKEPEHKTPHRASQRRPDVRELGGERLRARRREAVFEK